MSAVDAPHPTRFAAQSFCCANHPGGAFSEEEKGYAVFSGGARGLLPFVWWVRSNFCVAWILKDHSFREKAKSMVA